jgi:hypothetical protein
MTTPGFYFIEGGTSYLYDLSLEIPPQEGFEGDISGIQYVYFSRPVTIYGSYTDTYTGDDNIPHTYTMTFSINAKTGWNPIYNYPENETISVTTTDLSRVSPGSLRWFLDNYFPYPEEPNSGSGAGEPAQTFQLRRR